MLCSRSIRLASRLLFRYFINKSCQESKRGNIISSCHACHLITQRSLLFVIPGKFWQIIGLFGVTFTKPIQCFLKRYIFVSIFGFHAALVEFKKEESAYRYQARSLTNLKMHDNFQFRGWKRKAVHHDHFCSNI